MSEQSRPHPDPERESLGEVSGAGAGPNQAPMPEYETPPAADAAQGDMAPRGRGSGMFIAGLIVGLIVGLVAPMAGDLFRGATAPDTSQPAPGLRGNGQALPPAKTTDPPEWERPPERPEPNRAAGEYE